MLANYPGDELAKQAFDVMMRRKWGVIAVGERWAIECREMEPGWEWLKEDTYPDPFTALIKSDELRNKGD